MLGQGGFGVVYQCRHRELGSVVAVKEYFPAELAARQAGKVFSRNPSSNSHFEDGLRRFIEEGRQLEIFRNCPAIVTCRDMFRANGTAYMVMDLVPGMPLSELLTGRESSNHPFTEKDLLSVIKPLLEGLQAVHSAGVYHRDIKPSNILIRQDNSRPVLIDFGAAKQTATGITKSIAPYTEGYAAPEQMGEGRIGPWTDIYGVGAVMWRMIAGGSPPWNPPNPVSVQRRFYSQLQGKGDSMPTAANVGEGRFSAPLLQAIDDCLVLVETDRIQSSDELLKRLTGARPAHTIASKAAMRRPAHQGNTSLRGPSRLRNAKPRRWKGTRSAIVIVAVASVPIIGFALTSVLQNDSSGPDSGEIASNESVGPSAQPASIDAPLTVIGTQGTPSNARFVIWDGTRTYTNGSQLPPGIYTIRGTAPGYQSIELVVPHGKNATRSPVALRKILAVSEDGGVDSGNSLEESTAEPRLAQNGPAAQGTTARETGWTRQDRGRSAADAQASRTTRSWPYVSRQSLDSQVRRVLGAPDRIVQGTGFETWLYGSSQVIIDSRTRRVRSWYDSEHNDETLQESTAGRSRSITSGSNAAADAQASRTTTSWPYVSRQSLDSQVRRVLGAPDRIVQGTGFETWLYGGSQVIIDSRTRRVRSWYDSGQNDEMSQESTAGRSRSVTSRSNLSGQSAFSRGIHDNEVRRIQGASDRVVSSPDYSALFYGASVVIIDVQARRERSWSNSSRNLRAG